MSSEPRSGRRWFQFSLRALLTLMLVAASFFAGLVYRGKAYQQLQLEVERTRVELELQRTESQVSETMLKFHQLMSEGQRQEAAYALLEARRNPQNAMRQETETERDAALSRLDELLLKSWESLRSADNAALAPFSQTSYQLTPESQGRSPAEFWRSFQLDWGQLSPSGNESIQIPRKKSIQPPKTIPEMQFDAPLIDRTIG